MHQAFIVADHCIKYKQNQPILLQDLTTKTKCMKTLPSLLKFGTQPKLPTCISSTWHLTTVPNMKKINQFFSEISKQAHSIYVKNAIITQIWNGTKC